MTTVRVLVADDHGIVRRGLRSTIESEPGFQVIAEAANGRETVALVQQLKPDVAIVDIAMPQLNGIDATAQILKLSPATKVIILSMHSDESYVLRALAAQAKGYILKDSAEIDLLPCLRNVLQGRPYFSPKVTQVLLEDYMRYLRQRGLEDSYQLLTDRERQVLQLLAEGRSNKDVANLLSLGLSTVETHRTNLMQKLNLHSTAELVLYAVRKRIIS
ncbi:MAG: two component transcriptional regulator, LuxR family [Bryobacterales bacterium]|nr:two component transcriptional regulator, LuxR family [Bryobacterales bacterium]